MGIGVIVCGLNGAGKSTLGRALAVRLNWPLIDAEDLFFPQTGPDNPYASPRTRSEAGRLLLRETAAHERFVFASVKGDYGEAAASLFRYAVLVSAPREIRMQRVRDRSFQKWGERVLPGGDLYEQEERFFALVQSRAEDTVEDWVQTLRCPVLRVDGTRAVEENAALIAGRLAGQPWLYRPQL